MLFANEVTRSAFTPTEDSVIKFGPTTVPRAWLNDPSFRTGGRAGAQCLNHRSRTSTA